MPPATSQPAAAAAAAATAAAAAAAAAGWCVVGDAHLFLETEEGLPFATSLLVFFVSNQNQESDG